MVESEQIIVIDNGSDTIKAGFAGEEHPRAVFSSVVGRPKYDSFMHGTTQKSEYFGEEAMDKRGILNLSYPISAGIVESWEDMEKVWHQTFYYELLAEPAEAVGVILTETPLNPKQNRERMTEIMFDYFQAKNVYIALQGYMSLYATGRTTGLVCEIGDGVTHTTPVHEGYSIHNAINKTEIAGRFVTIQMQKLLQGQGITLTSSSEMEIVRDMKEKLAYVAQDYEKELTQTSSSSDKDIAYTMPDKRIVNVACTVRFQCPEVLFNPLLLYPELNKFSKCECKSLHRSNWASIQASNIDVRRDLCQNIILSGGSSMYEGLADRLKNEITNLAPGGAEIRVTASADRKYAVWKGASIISSLSTFSSSWVTAHDYHEHGAAIVHSKCN